jgi:hypothetical protein
MNFAKDTDEVDIINAFKIAKELMELSYSFVTLHTFSATGAVK